MNDRRRALPSVTRLLQQAERAGLTTENPRAVVVSAVRDLLERARLTGGGPPAAGWIPELQTVLAGRYRTSLVPVINATGVVLHTNLGRAPLAAAARAALADSAGYVALEYELDQGGRGSRQDHTRDLLRRLTGAEEAHVTTNAAAALLLALGTLADGGETIVSRGELVEIGGGFRIPEILQRSGTALIEVGTTNRVRLRDYQLALSPRTRAVLKVHRSNFLLQGFTSEVPLKELATDLAPRRIPLVHDVGSGLLVDLTRFGLAGEPTVPASVSTGAVVIFSGDKLLGGPQAGIIAGPAAPLRAMAANPLARALRPDKSTLAALEATLSLYRDEAVALTEIPTLRMLTTSPAELATRAGRLARQIGDAELLPGSSSVGGGAFPQAALPTTLVALAVPSCDAFLERLRAGRPPVIARSENGRVVLDVRTIAEDEIDAVVEAVRVARG